MSLCFYVRVRQSHKNCHFFRILSTYFSEENYLTENVIISSFSKLLWCVLLYNRPLKFVCVSVRYTRTHAQTAEPIVSKFCMSIEGHLAGNIGPVSCAWVYGGLRERRRKGGGSVFGDRELQKERGCEDERLREHHFLQDGRFCAF